MSWILDAATLLLAAQTTHTAIVGTVRDGESGEPLAGAVVALVDVDRAVATDEWGRYVFRAVPPGPQHLTVRRIGYAPRTLHALVPREGELVIDVALRPGPVVLRTVEVRPAVTVRGVDGGDSTAFPDRGISAAAVRNHPLLAEPDGLLALGGGEVALRPESPSGMHVRGGASDQTAYVLDGIPVFSPYHAAGTFGAWNLDALDRLQVSSASPSPALPDALSGVVTAVTRTPGPRVRAQGSASTAQARATVDGPLGVGDASYLVSARAGFPGVLAPAREPSYLQGETGDFLVKVEVGALGGRVRVLGYDSVNELDAAASAGSGEAPPADAGRNEFAWRSRSVGAEWARRGAAGGVRLRAWSAFGGADAVWDANGTAPLTMAAERRDEGLLAVVERGAPSAASAAGVRIDRSRTSFRVRPAAGGAPSFALGATVPVATVFVEQERPLGARLAANVALSAAAASGRVYAGPRAQLRWSASPHLALAGSYARSHQFSQSLRNPESVIANVFPADLYVGAGARGVPVARSNRGVLSAEYRPADGVRLGAQVYVRDFAGILLVAPRAGDPFAVGDFASGAGTARGLAVDGAVSGARYGLVASYGGQRVRFERGDSSYVPEHGARHLMEAGVIFFPSATLSLRLGATGVVGRRATPVAGAFEWESCNLLDQGCELGGSPRQATDRLGAAKLPPYWRLDLGVRKHWHVDLRGRDASVAFFGTVTNVLGRRNVLTVTDAAAGERTAIGMRPRAPLVVGLDWQL